MKAFRVEDDIELALEIDDIAFAELASDDLHDWESLDRGGFSGRTIPIFSRDASLPTLVPLR